MKNSTTAVGIPKQKTYSVSKKSKNSNKTFQNPKKNGEYTGSKNSRNQPEGFYNKSSIKAKKQSAAAIQNYFDNSKMMLNNSVTYATKSKKPKQKRGVVASKASKYVEETKNKHNSNSEWEMLANFSSSSRERKYSTYNFTKSKKVTRDELFNDIENGKNVWLVNMKQPFNMYQNEKKVKKYSTSTHKHPKHGMYSSYTNMSKKKQHKANSQERNDRIKQTGFSVNVNDFKNLDKQINNEHAHMHISMQDDHRSMSSKKKKNIFFKLANELSHSPDAVKIKKAYGKDQKKANYDSNKINLYKAIPGFGQGPDWSGNRLNTEATDDNSVNSNKNRPKTDFAFNQWLGIHPSSNIISYSQWNKAGVIYNKGLDMPSITLDDSKTPDTKGGRTISYNNEIDNYNKARNDDDVTCKRDWAK
jgi:hypothetical protein